MDVNELLEELKEYSKTGIKSPELLAYELEEALKDRQVIHKWNDSSGEEHEYFDHNLALAQLLIDEKAFVNEREISDGGDNQGRNVVVFLICNDLFAWACADGENITRKELQDIYEHHMKDKIYGTDIWVMKKRNEKPQKPMEKAMKESGTWDLFDVDNLGLENNTSDRIMSQMFSEVAIKFNKEKNT